MANINRNETLRKFEELYTTQTRFKVFDKVYIFEKFIDKVLDFNRKINFDTKYENLQKITTAEELVEIYQLRSEIYGNLGYQNEFPDYLPNMNFDFYDENSAIIYTKSNNEITSTCRLIFDSDKNLPIEEKIDLSTIRNTFQKIAETSRLMVKNEQKSLNMAFKFLTTGIYNILVQNNLDATLAICTQEHLKLYQKLGGITIQKELESYGHLEQPFAISTWNPNEVSRFFQKAFLKAS